MVISQELKGQFNASFSRLMKSTPPELQKKWDGQITWKDDRSYPHIQTEIIQELPPAAKAWYVTLLNKLSRGKI